MFMHVSIHVNWTLARPIVPYLYYILYLLHTYYLCCLCIGNIILYNFMDQHIRELILYSNNAIYKLIISYTI